MQKIPEDLLRMYFVCNLFQQQIYPTYYFKGFDDSWNEV